MEEDRLQKHRCKVCRKSFPSGRSLGGHMRSHFHMAVVGSSENNAEERSVMSSRGTGYGLREKPKKTWRMSDYTGDEGEKRCRECGKEFLSWRALFGHMRCHSERMCPASEEQEEQEGSWSNGRQSESEDAAVAVPRRKRGSRRMAAAIAASSSSVSEYEKEEEYGAISLMMLSRDVWCCGGGSGGRGGIHSFTESSDKNSAVFEGQGIGEGDGDFVPRYGGCWRNGFKRSDSDASGDWFIKDNEFKKPKVSNSDADEPKDFDEEPKKDSSKKQDLNSALSELGLKPRFDGSEFEIQKQRYDVSDAEYVMNSIEKSRFESSDGGSDKAPGRRIRFECSTCNKTFSSYQALGGHRASHRRTKVYCGSENSLETDASVDQAAVEAMVDRSAGINGSSKKAKGHECLLCGKVFASGQALGGHKRAHLVMNSNETGDTACRQTIVIQQQSLEMPDLLDLNLPAPIDEEFNSTNGNAEMKSWWAGSNLKHEPLVGVISN